MATRNTPQDDHAHADRKPARDEGAASDDGAAIDASSISIDRYLDVTVGRTAQRVPTLDTRSMAVSIAISQVSSMHVRAAERGAHQARGRNWLGFRLLYMIWMFEPVEAKDLARFAQISRQTISSALSVLEADGLITRSRSSATDRRLVQLGLTEKGRDEARESILAQNNAMTEWLHVLDEDEQDTLLRLLRRLHAHHPGEL